MLDSEREEGAFRDLQELLLVAANLGNDQGAGPRSVFARHIYTVLGARFRDGHGTDLGLTLVNRELLAPHIDATRSIVTLRNPHKGFEPDPSGEQDGGDGVFDLSLEQFCRLFTSVELAEVRS